jgi:hypothetical protein
MSYEYIDIKNKKLRSLLDYFKKYNFCIERDELNFDKSEFIQFNYKYGYFTYEVDIVLEYDEDSDMDKLNVYESMQSFYIDPEKDYAIYDDFELEPSKKDIVDRMREIMKINEEKYNKQMLDIKKKQLEQL